ncbi:AAA family ATPase [Candidatus Parcubacteria bacterium]|nr:AAA family ATPase [Candidatus Parcubacteria bacterium]
MYLRRLKINGFKSFAGKTVLDFEPGISAIVGPNGSGKSNVADAIRWGLGEQSSKNLRLKKSEELVFAGTDKRPKASLAEVSLLLDNSDGAMAIDFSEIELSRVLYRSGESEYKLNGRRVARHEVQQLLAQSGFGQNSYAVIGQGMIDNFILATPAERKMLFDEASGIRQYELKRAEAGRKLEATGANLTRARDIITELEPRLKTLQRGVEAAKQHGQLKAELTQKRRAYVAAGRRYHEAQLSGTRQELEQLAKTAAEQAGTVKALEEKRRQIQADYALEQRSREKLTKQLRELELQRDELSNDLSVKRAELQSLEEHGQAAGEDARQVKRLEGELAKNSDVQRSLQQAITKAEAAEAESVAAQEAVDREIRTRQNELGKLRRDSEATSRQEFITQALAILKQVASDLGAVQANGHQLRLMVYKAGRLLAHAREGQDDVLGQMRALQQRLNGLLKRRDDIHDGYTSAVIRVRSLELDREQADNAGQQLSRQLSEAKRRLAQRRLAVDKAVPERRRQLASLDQRLTAVNQAVTELRGQLAGGPAPESPAEQVFRLAADLEAAKSHRSASQARQAELTDRLARHRQALGEYAARARDWAGEEVAGAGPAEPDDSWQSLERRERELAVLDARLSDGGADQAVMEEYREVEGRHRFMTEQVADLERAQADMAKVIAQLEQLIKTKFEAAFADISKHFEAYFERLFNGGRAGLALRVDAAGVYGIEIKASPPGKRVEGLAMLSGGERALTGIALLAAILHASPSPFVVLDEVDAALDEANSGRLAGILRDIAKRSQLIVITHNRQTMQAAHSLYGVTMDEHQVSKLLSIRLEEARELAVK